MTAITILLHTPLNPRAGGHVITVVGSIWGTSLPRRSWYGIAGAALLIASGAIHLDLYLTGYNSIPTIGWLFLLQIIAAFALAVVIPVTGLRLAYAAGALGGKPFALFRRHDCEADIVTGTELADPVEVSANDVRDFGVAANGLAVHAEHYRQACACMPGGETRSVTLYQPYPVVLAEGQGALVRDLDGNEYVDVLNNYTSLVHGHAFGPVVAAVSAALPAGTVFPAPPPAQVRLAFGYRSGWPRVAVLPGVGDRNRACWSAADDLKASIRSR